MNATKVSAWLGYRATGGKPGGVSQHFQQRAGVLGQRMMKFTASLAHPLAEASMDVAIVDPNDSLFSTSLGVPRGIRCKPSLWLAPVTKDHALCGRAHSDSQGGEAIPAAIDAKIGWWDSRAQLSDLTKVFK
ncbi:MAG: hypothetical protein E6K96_02385 [Thaumarchaeota archaeon]|nr:MAG: hypothetical protein E6K96_02385 [Nitrososphaerota archaeon]